MKLRRFMSGSGRSQVRIRRFNGRNTFRSGMRIGVRFCGTFKISMMSFKSKWINGLIELNISRDEDEVVV